MLFYISKFKMHSCIEREATIRRYSTKPYAVMEFDSLIATALSYRFIDTNYRAAPVNPHLYPASQKEFINNKSTVDFSDQPSDTQNEKQVNVDQQSNNWLPVLYRGISVLPNTHFHNEDSIFKAFRDSRSPSAGHTDQQTCESTLNFITDFVSTTDRFRYLRGPKDRSVVSTEQLSCWPTPIEDIIQKPGQNLIRPVAFKPLHTSSALSPVGPVTRRQPGTDHQVNGSHEVTRSQGIKMGTDILLAMKESPEIHRDRSNIGAFSSMAKFQYPNNGSVNPQTPINTHQHVDTFNHSHPLVSYSQTTDNSHKGSQQSVLVNSHHSTPSNSYSNIPINFHASVNSSNLCAADENSISSEFPSPSDRPDSIPSLNINHMSSHAVEGMLQTPSPSDSGVGELEAMLREKDAEINTLREVMERNERAIFQVYEERRNVWLHETQELQNEYERRLKVQSRKSYKTEQVLSHQVYKLQQEQKILQEENEKIINEREMLKQQVGESQNLITHLKQKLEAVMTSEANCERYVSTSQNTEEDNRGSMLLQEELSVKNKDVIFLEKQLSSVNADMDKKNKDLTDIFRDLAAKTGEVNSLKDQLLHFRDAPVFVENSTQTLPNDMITSENTNSSIFEESNQDVNSLQEELMDIREQVVLLNDEHEKERAQWLDEKNKVIRYQKQLQLNYVQMQRKNTALENEVQQLTLELENRDMKLIALSGEESVC